MLTDQLTNAIVKTAVEALNRGDRAAWFALFTPDATLTDDGSPHDFAEWSDSELFGKGQGRLTSIERVEDGGLFFYGTIHSAQWGDIYGTWKFTLRDGKIARLDVAAA